MDKDKIISFFNRAAEKWDEDSTDEPAVINVILDRAGIREGVSVLDVACGTGVLFPFYLERGVGRLTGIDISPKMIARAKNKFTDPRIELVNGDVEEAVFPSPFDRCIVYNSFPHFANPARLLNALAGHVAPGGRLTVAHGKSRAEIDRHHRNHAREISLGLMPENELAGIFSPHFSVDIILSDDRMFIVSGVKRKQGRVS